MEEGAGMERELGEEGGREASRVLREGECMERLSEWVMTGSPFSGIRIRSWSCSLQLSRMEATEALCPPAFHWSLYVMEV